MWELQILLARLRFIPKLFLFRALIMFCMCCMVHILFPPQYPYQFFLKIYIWSNFIHKKLHKNKTLHLSRLMCSKTVSFKTIKIQQRRRKNTKITGWSCDIFQSFLTWFWVRLPDCNNSLTKMVFTLRKLYQGLNRCHIILTLEKISEFSLSSTTKIL